MKPDAKIFATICFIGILSLSLAASGLPKLAISAFLLVFAIPILVDLDLWRMCICVSLTSSVLRTGALHASLPAGAWYAAQYAPLVLAILIASLSNKDRQRASAGLMLATLALALTCLISSVVLAYSASAAGDAAMFSLYLCVGCTASYKRWTDGGRLLGDMRAIFFAIVCLEVAGLAGGLLGQDWAFLWGFRFRGLFVNPNYTAILASLGFSIGLFVGTARQRWPAWVVFGESFLLLSLLWSGSRGALAALLCAAAYFFADPSNRKARRAVTGAICIFTPLILLLHTELLYSAAKFFVHDENGGDASSGRLDIWKALVQIWEQHPLFGIGFHAIQGLPETSGLAAHNIILQFLVETGLMGLACLLVFSVTIWATRSTRGPRRALSAAFLCVVVNEMFESSITGTGNSVSLVATILILSAAEICTPSAPGPRARSMNAEIVRRKSCKATVASAASK